MSCIKDDAKIGCKYLTLADRGLNPTPNGNIKVSKDVYDEVFWGGRTELIQNIPYYLSGTIENNKLILKRNRDNRIIANGRNPVMKLGLPNEKTIVRKVRELNNPTKSIYMFYSISDDKNNKNNNINNINNIKPIFVFLEQGSQAWNAAENSEIIFAQLDDTVLYPGDNMYNPVKDFINNCFNADWNNNLANQVGPNCTEEYIKIPIKSITGDNPTQALATELLSRLNIDNAEERRIVKVNYFGLQYAKAIIDSQITNNDILESIFTGEQYKALRESYRKNLEGMQTLFKDCKVVRTYENNVIDNDRTTTNNNNVVNNINAPEAKNDGNINKPRNLIVFGAPGTGKSYKLEEDRRNSFKDNYYERITFHPDYSFAQFVGTYKPVSENEHIEYKFVPGPFIRIFIKAINDPNNNYLLLIEEINRANVSNVFGDIFQLLDRDNEGNSCYPIDCNEDIRNYLNVNGINLENNKLFIPSNMYIWATMNSADQGVFPLDTAFKRRWNFEYIGINSNENRIECNIELGSGDRQHKISWNALRRAINDYLSDLGINEDKQLGPFFIGANINQDCFKEVFKNKVIMYLFDDAAKHKRQSLFAGVVERNRNSYSSICEAFDSIGMYIFNESISTNVPILNENEVAEEN